MDKDRFSKDPGGLIEAYQEVARRRGIFVDNRPGDGPGPVLVSSK
jgi:phosphoribosylaminoimidazole-succinocarboxamide synthase